ncbi:MAG: phosphonate C-P lyase system protein PhnH [bacterium]|nr:phosphonate C-P lyase system protein PhnH [bacterium]
MLDTKSADIEQYNRFNFRAALDALARPGECYPIRPLFSSPLLAMASVLLYGETSYFYQGKADFELVRAISGAANRVAAEADYLFADAPEQALVEAARIGSGESPEAGATLIFLADAGASTQVRLSGPGINGFKELRLPLSSACIQARRSKNAYFPLGIDILLLDQENKVLSLPRTTAIEILEVPA